MSLRTDVFERIDEEVGAAFINVPHHKWICNINGFRVNVRTASDKGSTRYWFDVTPSYYEQGEVDYFLYACGYPDTIYIIPSDAMQEMIATASPGGQKQVPNFNILTETDQLEPAGDGQHKWPLGQYLNNFQLLKRKSDSGKKGGGAGTAAGQAPAQPLHPRIALLSAAEHHLEAAGAFDAKNVTDARDRAMRSIVLRRGQSEFRSALLRAYGGRCAITDCDAPNALEATHIVPYKGPETNHPTNGLLFRADIHALFDLGLIAVDTSTMQVLVSPDLLQTTYAELRGRRLRPPRSSAFHPDRTALEEHRRWARL